MTTNQEGRQAAIRDSTSTAYGVAADWHALFDDAGISAGTFNERLLAWINAELSASYSNLVSAMQAYAEDAGYDGWEDMATLVLAMNGAETLLDGETQGLAFDFTDQSALIIDTGTPANNYDSTGIVSNGSLVGPSGKLTYTSPSNKLTMQADGVMRYQAHNFATHSEDFSSWTKYNAALTSTATSIVESNTTIDQGVYIAPTNIVAGSTYVLSFEVARASGSRDVCIQLVASGGADVTRAYFDMDGAASADTVVTSGTSSVSSTTMTDIGGGYYKVTMTGVLSTSAASAICSIFISNGTANGNQNYLGDGSSGLLVRKAHLYRYPANTDYISTTTAAKYALPLEYSATDGSCLGMLVEEQRTNLCLQNSALSTSPWTNISTAYTASTYTLTATNVSAYARQTLTLADSTTYNFSVEVAPGTSNWVYLFFRNKVPTDVHLYFNASDGTFGTVTGITTYSAEQTESGWWRVNFNVASGTGATTPFIQIQHADGDGDVAVTAGNTIRARRVQFEAGSFPTSLVVTYGAAATRNADPLSQLTSTFPLSATAGSLYAYVAPYAGADLAGVVSLNDGSGDEEIVIYKDASSNIVAQVEDGGVNQLAPLDSTVNASSGTAFKVALAWAANDFAISANGTAAQTDTGGTLPTVTTLEIGVDQANNYFNGHIKAISYVPRRKSNAELQAETA